MLLKKKNSFSPIVPDLINTDVQWTDYYGGPDMDEEPKVSNVIIFPGPSRNRPPQSLEEIFRNVELAKTTRIEEVTEHVIVNVFEDLYANNYDFTERQDANKDMAFLIEAVKSILHRHDGLDHPFHDLAEQFFVADANGDLSFVESSVVEVLIEVTDIESDLQ